MSLFFGNNDEDIDIFDEGLTPRCRWYDDESYDFDTGNDDNNIADDDIHQRVPHHSFLLV